MKTNLIYVLSLVFALLVGCATILQPGPDRIPVDSSPLKGAKIYLDDLLVGATPTVIWVPRSSECVIRIELEGYETVTVDRDKNLNGWFLGNILIGGVIGITVDLIAHNQGGYSEQPISVELKATTANGAILNHIIQLNPIDQNH